MAGTESGPVAAPGVGPAAPLAAKPLWLKAAPFLFLLMWSSGFPFLAIAQQYTTPLTFLSLRYALVFLVLVPLTAILRPAWPRRLADFGHLAVVGVLIQVIYFAFSYMAFQYGASVGAIALICSLQPILVAALAPMLARERVPVTRWAGLCLGLAGAVAVILARSTVEATSLVGLACAGIAVSGITLGTLYEKRFGGTQHPVMANLIQYAVGFVVTLPLALLLEPFQVQWTWALIGVLVYLSIGNSLISISLLLAMVKAGEASRVSALFFLIPPVVAVMAWGLLGETMPLLAWPGILLAALGVYLATR
ncbi:DMT family transporter [Zavarzinia sp. CC-PAN008]|uniref:DMT family transporter n=1 Tax=Zavarzinia sp. CC-PAN008 TaxID=3243332 RepID=UPI003F7462AE